MGLWWVGVGLLCLDCAVFCLGLDVSAWSFWVFVDLMGFSVGHSSQIDFGLGLDFVVLAVD